MRRAAGHALLPEVEPALHSPSRRHRLAALATTVTAIAATAGVWGAIEYRHWWQREVGPQVSPLRATAVAGLAPIAGGPSRGAAPIVLAYHDIGPNPQRSPYVVSPQEFVDQMTAIKHAGYVALSGDQFRMYVEGSYTPPNNSVFITFDDGTRGLYRFADPVLRSLGFKGMSFLITGRVSTSSYYLTWSQVGRMASTGRWSFGGHTHGLHTKIEVDGRGPRSALTNRRLLADGRREPLAVFTARIAGDVTTSLADFSRHDLPRPTMFAWPFSEARDPSLDRRAAAVAGQAITRTFPVRFVNTSAPDAASRRSVRADAIERLEVLAGTRTPELLTSMRQMQTVSVDNPAGGVWLVNGRTRAAVEVRGGSLGVRPERVGSATSTSGDWMPQQSADWVDYRVRATLRVPDDGRSSLRVRVGSPNELRIVVERASFTVMRRTRVRGGKDVAIGEYSVGAAKDHRLTVDVAGSLTHIEVDGISVDVPTRSGAVSGGVGVDFGRADGGPWGHLDALQVQPLAVTGSSPQRHGDVAHR